MRSLISVALCMSGMVGFWYLCQFLIMGVSEDFGHGVFTGAMLFIVIFWLGERLGAFKVVEPSKGTWIPHDQSGAFRRNRDL